ncbi:uncharacterized protein LOC126825402 isoform X2 [Patella vulgata]|uniref:uncharacterized protein LOC126825402 isoform X2 n=1 Tax=Patella vulgata TaxID=6465 RepID=UPI0021806D58|nr:uncharacterized protein LOC126825402 isoform X2 [Patella vulgata]
MKSVRLCFRCLKSGHMYKFCSVKTKCSKCDGSHHSIMHTNSSVNPGGEMFSNKLKPDVISALMGKDMEAGTTDCTMAIIPVQVKMRGCFQSFKTYAFLDPGSSVSFCTLNVMKLLGCSGRRTKLTIDTMGSSHTMVSYLIKGMQLGDLTLETVIDLPDIYTKDNMPVSHGHIPTSDDIRKWANLKGIDLPVLDAEIGLLIGNNVPDAYSPLEIKTGPPGSPHSVRSALGWIIWNLFIDSSRLRPTVNRAEIQAVQDLENLRQMVQQTASLDFPERAIDDVKENSQDDNSFIKKLNKTLKFEDGHYTIGLPFRKDQVSLPNNKSHAECRLNSLVNKIKRNPLYH